VTVANQRQHILSLLKPAHPQPTLRVILDRSHVVWYLFVCTPNQTVGLGMRRSGQGLGGRIRIGKPTQYLFNNHTKNSWSGKTDNPSTKPARTTLQSTRLPLQPYRSPDTRTPQYRPSHALTIPPFSSRAHALPLSCSHTLMLSYLLSRSLVISPTLMRVSAVSPSHALRHVLTLSAARPRSPALSVLHRI